MEIYALIVLIVLNGFFAMSEIALVSARRARLQPLVEKGDSAARVAAELGAEPTRYLSTVQIGITSVAMLLSSHEYRRRKGLERMTGGALDRREDR